jgi:general secretion pathway protein J
VSRRARRAPRRGFTLIEVLIAAAMLASMGALVFGSFNRSWVQKQEIEKADERISQVRLAMDRLAYELSVAFLSEHYDRKRFRERPTLFKGEDRGRRDEIIFTALANERFEKDEKTSDQVVIKYFVDRDPENRRIESLFRRVNPIIDEEADRRGVRSVLCENVKEFELAYWDAQRSEWVDEWDASRSEHMGVLPERVKITLVVIDDAMKEHRYTTQTRVMLQRSLDF